MNETDYIILKKTPFRETSFIVSGISPEFGRIDFLMRGRLSGKAGKFFLPGLFRELHIWFQIKKADKQGLIRADKSEFVSEFDAVSENIPGYLAACNVAAVILANTEMMVPVPETYRAFRLFLQMIQAGNPPEPYESLVYLTLLHESGELPPQEGRAGEFLQSLLNCAGQGRAVPDGIPDSYWTKLVEWRKIVCRKMVP